MNKELMIAVIATVAVCLVVALLQIGYNWKVARDFTEATHLPAYCTFPHECYVTDSTGTVPYKVWWLRAAGIHAVVPKE